MDDSGPLVFDGHNDVLSKLFGAGGMAQVGTFLTGREGAIDLPKARAGGFGGGFFAVYVASPIDRAFKMSEMDKPSYDLPLPEPVDWEDALPVAVAQVAILLELERRGALTVCRSVADIR
ncbi:membrane dipeptidase, partial [Cribrihabitans sp. XS_ASV171]